MDRWAELSTMAVGPTDTSWRRRLTTLAPALVVMALVLVWLFLRHPAFAAIAAVVMISLVVARFVSPKADRAIARFLEAFGHGVGRVLSLVLLGLVTVVVLVPASLVCLALAWNPLEPDKNNVGHWSRRGVRPWLTRPDRLFAYERPLSRGLSTSLHGIAVGVVFCVGAVAVSYGAWLALDRIDLRGESAAGGRTQEGGGIFAGGFTISPEDDESWVDQYYAELDQVAGALVFDPFRSNRNPDVFDAEYINITDQVRDSYQAPSSPDDPVDVWFFGGSTMFGVGQRDDYTIASGVARLAEHVGVPVRVWNFGVTGYVNWQSDLLLAEMLERREAPDLIVTYAGANEVSLYGAPEAPTTPSHFFADQVRQALIDNAQQNFAPDVDYTTRLPAGTDVMDNAASMFNEGVSLADHLAQSYDVPIVQFFQPILWTTEQEAAIQPVLELRGWDQSVYDETAARWAEVRELVDPSVVDIADAMDDVTEPVYTDEVHTDEQGAAVVAEAIFVAIQEQLEELADDG